MLWLSEIIMENHELESFSDLTRVITDKAKAGERFFSMDVRPPYPDTPENWEEKLEAIFTSAN